MAVHPSVRTSIGRIKKKLIIEDFTSNVEKLYALLNSGIYNGYLHKDKRICKTTLRRIFLRRMNFSKGICRKIKEGVYV